MLTTEKRMNIECHLFKNINVHKENIDFIEFIFRSETCSVSVPENYSVASIHPDTEAALTTSVNDISLFSAEGSAPAIAECF